MDTEPVLDYLCATCQTGHLQPRLAALATWIGDEFITLPSFPAWVCDLCGACEYDAEALELLQAALGPQVSRRRSRHPAHAGPRRTRAAQRGAGRHFV